MSADFELRAVGDCAVVVDCPDLATAGRVSRAVEREPPTGTVDVVPGARSVLVRVVPGTDLRSVARDLRRILSAVADVAVEAEPRGELVVVPVRYNGPDLAQVAELAGLSVGDVVDAHTGTSWSVAFVGFAPGFAYLSGGDPRLAVPRRDHPRPRVPVGAVAVAGEFSGVYPRSSPGGWQLIGTTEAKLWDLAREPAALLRPGARVRFEAIT